MYSYTHVPAGLPQAFADDFSSFGASGSSATAALPGADTSRTSAWSSGTYPRSVSTIPMSVTESYPSGGTYTTSSTTVELSPKGSSTGVDSWSWEDYGNASYSFTTGWTGSSGSDTTFLSATATGTTTHSGYVTRTLSGTTLVPLFAPYQATVRRWYVQREHPYRHLGSPPLSPVARRVGRGYAATGTFVSSLTAGANSYLSDLSLGSTASTDVFVTNADTYTTARTGWSGRSITSSRSAVPQISAVRKSLLGSHVVWDGSWGSTLSVTPDVSGLSLLAPVAQNLSSIRVWRGRSVHGGTTFAWSHQSSSWRLWATSSSGTSSSSYRVSLSLSGSLQTVTAVAYESIPFETFNAQALTTAVLGPLIPATTLDLHVISVSSLTSASGAQGVYASFLDSSASSTSRSFSVSQSELLSLGTGSAFPATYASSRLPWAARLPAFTHETTTWSALPLFDLMDENPGGIPALLKNARWNEAGRAELVTVQE